MNGGTRPLTDTLRGFRQGWMWLGAAIITCLVLAVVAPGESRMRLGLSLAGLALVFVAAAVAVVTWLDGWGTRRLLSRLAMVADGDPAPCLATDAAGVILYRNAAAMARHDVTGPLDTLDRYLATPAAVLRRLATDAVARGAATTEIAAPGVLLRLAVHRIGAKCLFWRVQELDDTRASAAPADLPMLIADGEGTIIAANPALQRLLGTRPRRLDRLFGTGTLATGDEVGVTTATGPMRALVAVTRAGTDQREIFLFPVPRGDAPGTTSEDFETIPVAMMKFGALADLWAANREARDLLGDKFSPDLSFHDLFDGLGRPASDWLADVAEGRAPAGAEVMHLRTAGAEDFVQVRLSPVHEHGRTGALAILTDATALKRLEMQFNQSQKMQAVGQLAGGIAHDFNNLLTAISGHCDLLLLRHAPDDNDFSDLEQIRQNANRAADLVSQLLAFSRKQTMKAEQLDLHDVLGEAAHLLNRLVGEKITLELGRDPALLPVRADRRQLEQVLMNLVINARDAMPAGGTIRIGLQALDLDQPRVRGRVTIPAGRYSVIRVEDSGTGIPPDRIDKVFEPFFTSKRPGEGTGLGLSTVYGIIKQSGGYVFAESTPGTGTTFEILFPALGTKMRANEPVTSAPRDAAPSFVRDGAGTILLVEDEAPVRAFASRALQLRGYDVVEAASAEEALQRLEDAGFAPDLFITDVVMPGIDGPSWVRRALADRPDVGVIFVSGYAEDALRETQARIPNSVFLPKPFSLAQLTDTVQEQMTRRNPAKNRLVEVVHDRP